MKTQEATPAKRLGFAADSEVCHVVGTVIWSRPGTMGYWDTKIEVRVKNGAEITPTEEVFGTLNGLTGEIAGYAGWSNSRPCSCRVLYPEEEK